MVTLLPIFFKIAEYLGIFGRYVITLFTTPITDIMAEHDLLQLGVYNPFVWIVDQVVGNLTLLELMFTAGVGFILIWGLIKFLLPTS